VESLPFAKFNDFISSKGSIRLSSPHHLLAISVESVVNDPFGGIQLVIVFEAKMPKSLGDGVQTGRLWLMPQRIVGVGSIDDLRQQNKCWIARQPVLFHQGVEGALLTVMSEFDVWHIVGNGPFSLSDFHYIIGWDEQELGLWVDELVDQPRAGHSINLDSLSRDPLHGNLSFLKARLGRRARWLP
jgi:hypothetical protein